MTNHRTVKVLANLYRIVEAGEKGYAVCAANVNNQGLKVLFKSHAQQRFNFGSEILAEIRRLGSDIKPRSSIRGVIHRGRIDIFAALTIGKEEQDKVVLNEIVPGENVAISTYEKTLNKELPPETRKLVARQYEEVRKVVEQIHLLRGKAGKRMIIRLFGAEKDSEVAVRKLENAGFHLEEIERISLDKIELYKGRSTTIFETAISGSVGGAMWGSLFGVLAGIGAEQTANLTSFGASPAGNLWVFIALGGIAAGSLVGAALGSVVGMGISGQDTYQYAQSIKNGKVILLMLTEFTRSSEAGRILSQVGI